MNEIVIAVVAAFPPTLAALAAWRKAHGAERSVRPNGMGTLTEMNERQLLMLGRIEERLNHHLSDPHAHD